MEFKSSYKEYRKILGDIKRTGKLIDYLDVSSHTKEFILLRHDVEFSVERAYEMSLIEDEYNIKSSYFFQLSNNAYNILSKKNLTLIKDIHNRGHHIGLHFHLNGLLEKNKIMEMLEKEIKWFNEALNMKIDRFSIHRPSKEVLKMNIKVSGLVNTYDELFFTFVDDLSKLNDHSIKYISDSMHKWNYGSPYYEYLKKFDKVQILVHPYSWSLEGHNNLFNFRSLLDDKRQLFIETFDIETKHFKEIKNEL